MSKKVEIVSWGEDYSIEFVSFGEDFKVRVLDSTEAAIARSTGEQVDKVKEDSMFAKYKVQKSYF